MTGSGCSAAPGAGNLIYPKIAPAVIVAVTHGDRILMTRYQGGPTKGYALIAGFTEVGETAEDTVRRRFLKRWGLRVKDIRYYGSQPGGWIPTCSWAFSPTWRAGRRSTWTARSSPGRLVPGGRRFDLAPDGYSLTNHMIQAFRRGDWGLSTAKERSQ